MQELWGFVSRLRPDWDAWSAIAGMVSATMAFLTVRLAVGQIRSERRRKDVEALSSTYRRVVAEPVDQALHEFHTAATPVLDEGVARIRTLVNQANASHRAVVAAQRHLARDFQVQWNRLALRLTQAAEAWRDRAGSLRTQLREEGAEKLQEEITSTIQGLGLDDAADPGFGTMLSIHCGRIQRIVLVNDPAIEGSEVASAIIVLEDPK